MITKEEKQLIRYAIRHRWLSAEEGEDILFLRKRFGAKYTIAELIRQRQYLDDDELESLFAAAGADFDRRQQRTGIFRLASITGGQEPESSARSAVRNPTNRRSLAAKPQPTPAKSKSARKPQRRVRRKLNALASSSSKARETLAPSATFEPVESPQVELQAHQVDEETPERTVIDMNAMALLESLRSEIRADDDPEETLSPSAGQGEPASEEYQLDVSNTFDAADLSDQTVVGIPGLLEAIQEGLGEPGEDTDQHPIASTEGDAATMALTPDDLALMRDALQKETRTEEALALPPSSMSPINYGDSAGPLERTRSERSELVSDTAGTATESEAPAWSNPPDPKLMVPEPSGEAPIVRSRSSLNVLLSAAVRDSEELKAGEHFGRYEIIRCLARENTSLVYLARHRKSGGEFALKILRNQMNFDPDFVTTFLEESQKLVGFSSPHLVDVYEVGEIDNTYYSVLKFVEGWSLDERLTSGETVSWAEALGIARSVALALDAITSLGMVHQDIRPSNILMARDGSVRLTNFGLGEAITPAIVQTVGGSGRVTGRPEYVSPEQIMGSPLDIRSDFYSLGVLLYRLITGRTAYSGPTDEKTLRMHLSQPHVPAQQIVPNVSSHLSELITRLLAKVPEHRYASTSQLVNAFDTLIDQVGASKRSQTSHGRDTEPTTQVYKKTVQWGGLGLVLCISLGLALGQFLTDTTVRTELVFKLTSFAALNFVCAMILFTGLGLIRRGELPLPSASAIFLKLKDLTAGLGGACLAVSALVGAPSAIRIIAGILAILTWATLVYGIVLRQDVARVRFDGATGRTLAILGDPRMITWRRVHALMLATLVGVSTVKYAMLKYFQASGL